MKIRSHPQIPAVPDALARFDPELADLVHREMVRQHQKVRLIPSENYVSHAVLAATGTVLTNKYSEGYVGRRYYEGQQLVDPIETLAIDRTRELFEAEHANVQPYSGSPCNLAVYLAFLQPGETVMGMAVPMGGHLTHGWNVSITGRYFNAVQYGVRRDTGLVDYDEVRALALEHRPKLLWAGGTAIPRLIDFETMAKIAAEAGAIFAVDMAHIAGLVAGGAHPSPVPHADVVTSTTHKTLRGPRGAFLLSRSAHANVLDRAVFPGLQGGPHNHTTAAIAVAMKEAGTPEFRRYAGAVVENAAAMAAALLEEGFELVSGGTDTHLILADLTHLGVTGKQAARALDRAGIELNYNTVPYDPRRPFDPSGIRLGTPSVTSRGMGQAEMRQIAAWMGRVVRGWQDEELISRTADEVRELCETFPSPGITVD
jgi:glycine hydroxymethyltransferase